MAQSLTATIKGQGSIARFAGNFFIIMLETNLENVIKVAEAVRKQVGMKQAMNAEPSEFMRQGRVSAALGKFCYRDSLLQLIPRSYEAMYVAKGNGRNQLVRN